MGKRITEEEIGSLLLKDIRILYNENDKGQISDLLVVEFTESHDPQFLYEEYGFDVGNCMSRWNEVTVTSIVFDFFVRHGYPNEDIKKDIWDNQFRKIKEIMEQLDCKCLPGRF